MASLWLLLALLPVLGGAERFSCRGRILGAYYADAKAHCKAFHVCVRVAGGGIRDFRFFCPPGTLFHQEAQTCTDWGDDELLACPADLYDGQFDLYKIGSGFDTKKVSSNNNRDEEADFGLQRAETGDRRLSQNSIGGSSDLRAAHSSDFFSGQRDRGRDDSPPPVSSSRQSFRRTPPPRSSPTPPQYSTPQPSPSSNKPQYDHIPPKRKLVRKRPVYVSTTTAPTFPPSTAKPRQYQEPQQNFVFRSTTEQQQQQQQQQQYQQQQQQQHVFPQTTLPPNLPPQYREEYVEVSRVAPKPNKYYTNTASPTTFVSSVATSPATRNPKKEGLIELYNYEAQQQQQKQQQQNNQQRQQHQQQFKLRNSFNVSPELKRPQERNQVSISPNGLRGNANGQEFSSSRNPGTSTAAYNNFNSVSYEPEKNFGQFSSAKQNYFISKNQSPSPTTTFTPTRADVSGNLNTIAYNTNVGFNAQPINYVENDEDDGQYRPPPGEDDGQYRPELYERGSERERAVERGAERGAERDRELLTGAHSLNIAASGNRLPDDQKPRTKGQTSAPRPFRPAPTPEISTSKTPEPTYTTTSHPQTVNTQRTFDYFQTYTTTSRPTDTPVTVSQSFSTPLRSSSSLAPRPPTSPPRPPSTAPPRPTTPRTQPPPPPKQSPPKQNPPKQSPPKQSPPKQSPPKQTPPPSFVKPANTKEDNSYDYAYYDTDPGFTEYDQIEEFGKTKVKA